MSAAEPATVKANKVLREKKKKSKKGEREKEYADCSKKNFKVIAII